VDDGGRGGYIRVGKEAGTKRAGRHGEKDRELGSSAVEARDGEEEVRRQTRNSSMSCAELVPGKQSARDSSPPNLSKLAGG